MIYEPRLPIIFIYHTSYQLYMLSKLDYLPTHNFLFIYKNCHNQASYDKSDHGNLFLVLRMQKASFITAMGDEQPFL